MQPELIADYACVTGEGPLWHEAHGCLYWTDIPAGRMFRYDPDARAHEQIYDGPPVGGFTIQADESLLLFGERGAIFIWRDGHVEPFINEIEEMRDTRFNDVIADPDGRVYCGTMPSAERPGRLYLLHRDGTLTTVLAETGISNGMAFSLDLEHVFHTDSSAREINRYRVDRQSGALSDRTLFVKTPEGEGVPDGMTVDERGFVWSARWDGSALFRYAPDGRQIRRFPFPARKVSSVKFGGHDYSHLYVTTAGGDNKREEGAGAGALFRLRTDARGRPEYLSRVGI